ncbi:hypothetical protein GGR56DRAFT_678640 [Xylariaceae sp. FL0804]|nr:hypothetical protein GGR56DRAFT_678640 [Xylariaceae sp. FL0804]
MSSDAAIPPLPLGFVLVKTSDVALNLFDYKVSTNYPLTGACVGHQHYQQSPDTNTNTNTNTTEAVT